MDQTIAALMPAIVTLVLGYLSGRHKDFKSADAGVLNRVVMMFSLPMGLFAGTISMPKASLVADIPLMAWVCLPTAIGFLLIYLALHYWLKRSMSEAAIIAMLIAAPGIPFIGGSVLPYLFGKDATPIIMTAGALALNLFLTPAGLILLGADKARKAQALSGAGAPKTDIGAILWNSLKEPIVWAPVLAFALVLMGVHVSETFTRSLQLLGSVTSGIAMFSTGIILYSYNLKFNATILLTTLARNLLFPAAVWAIAWACGIRGVELNEIVVALSIPAASMAAILAVQFQVMQQEASSVTFLSYVTAPLTMALFINFA